MEASPGLPLKKRLLVAGLAGTLMAALTYAAYRLSASPSSDFDSVWTGLHAFVHGENPYRAVAGAGLHAPLFYPLPALVALAPLGLLPVGLARIIFAALGYAALAYAGAGRRGGLLVALISASAVIAALGGQWSPLLTAGAVVPWLSVLWVAKPSLGLALAVAYPSRPALWGAVGLTVLSFVLMPGWLADWIPTLGDRAHLPLLARPGGFILLLAATRWRRPEGRLLVALTCIPGSAALYETVPLFLVANTRYEGYALALLSCVASGLMAWLVPEGKVPEMMAGWWPILLLLLYLPALLMVLARPNERPA